MSYNNNTGRRSRAARIKEFPRLSRFDRRNSADAKSKKNGRSRLPKTTTEKLQIRERIKPINGHGLLASENMDDDFFLEPQSTKPGPDDPLPVVPSSPKSIRISPPSPRMPNQTHSSFPGLNMTTDLLEEEDDDLDNSHPPNLANVANERTINFGDVPPVAIENDSPTYSVPANIDEDLLMPLSHPNLLLNNLSIMTHHPGKEADDRPSPYTSPKRNGRLSLFQSNAQRPQEPPHSNTLPKHLVDFLQSLYHIRENLTTRDHVVHLQKEIDYLRDQNERLQGQINRLRNSTFNSASPPTFSDEPLDLPREMTSAPITRASLQEDIASDKPLYPRQMSTNFAEEITSNMQRSAESPNHRRLSDSDFLDNMQISVDGRRRVRNQRWCKSFMQYMGTYFIKGIVTLETIFCCSKKNDTERYRSKIREIMNLKSIGFESQTELHGMH